MRTGEVALDYVRAALLRAFRKICPFVLVTTHYRRDYDFCRKVLLEFSQYLEVLVGGFVGYLLDVAEAYEGSCFLAYRVEPGRHLVRDEVSDCLVDDARPALRESPRAHLIAARHDRRRQEERILTLHTEELRLKRRRGFNRFLRAPHECRYPGYPDRTVKSHARVLAGGSAARAPAAREAVRSRGVVEPHSPYHPRRVKPFGTRRCTWGVPAQKTVLRKLREYLRAVFLLFFNIILRVCHVIILFLPVLLSFLRHGLSRFASDESAQPFLPTKSPLS